MIPIDTFFVHFITYFYQLKIEYGFHLVCTIRPKYNSTFKYRGTKVAFYILKLTTELNWKPCIWWLKYNLNLIKLIANTIFKQIIWGYITLCIDIISSCAIELYYVYYIYTLKKNTFYWTNMQGTVIPFGATKKIVCFNQFTSCSLKIYRLRF